MKGAPDQSSDVKIHITLWMHRHSDITWESWHLKSPATQLFVHQHVKVNIEENTKALHHLLFMKGILWWQVDSPHKGPGIMWKPISCYNITIFASLNSLAIWPPNGSQNPCQFSNMYIKFDWCRSRKCFWDYEVAFHCSAREQLEKVIAFVPLVTLPVWIPTTKFCILRYWITWENSC